MRKKVNDVATEATFNIMGFEARIALKNVTVIRKGDVRRDGTKSDSDYSYATFILTFPNGTNTAVNVWSSAFEGIPGIKDILADHVDATPKRSVSALHQHLAARALRSRKGRSPQIGKKHTPNPCSPTPPLGCDLPEHYDPAKRITFGDYPSSEVVARVKSNLMSEHVLTRNAYEKLKRELEDLKGPTRQRVAEAIREAKSHGDLRENAAYHEAKLNQARLESRIADLEKLLQIARVIEGGASGVDIADMGHKVKLMDLEWNDELVITLVSSYEADPANDLVSISSPLGSAVMGQGVGAEIEVDAPAGIQRYRILSID